ncbi:MAG: tetraacyldisaccharide 4'-kinase [Casimicrobium sp.]
MGVQSWLEQRWWRRETDWSAKLLAPLEATFALVGRARAGIYKRGWRKRIHAGRPVIVVGNLVVGGTGKTPVVQAIVRCLMQAGYNPGVISRGYPISPKIPIVVTKDSAAKAVGDEPILHARLGVPVVVCADRVAAAHELLERYPMVDILVADDALQHYRLYRDIEVEVVSSERGYGNGHLLPAGPMREPRERAKRCDVRIMPAWAPPKSGYKEGQHHIAVRRIDRAYSLVDPNRVVALNTFSSKRPHIIAGIANPRQFADALKREGVDGKLIEFPDHHEFDWGDFATLDPRPILMTEKDAVKCRGVVDDRMWVVPLGLSLATETKIKLLRRVAEVTGRKQDARDRQAAEAFDDGHSTVMPPNAPGAKPSKPRSSSASAKPAESGKPVVSSPKQ